MDITVRLGIMGNSEKKNEDSVDAFRGKMSFGEYMKTAMQRTQDRITEKNLELEELSEWMRDLQKEADRICKNMKTVYAECQKVRREREKLAEELETIREIEKHISGGNCDG